MIVEPKIPGRGWMLFPIGLVAISIGLFIAHAFVGDGLAEADLMDAEFEESTEAASEPELLETNSLFPETRIVSASWHRNPTGANEDTGETEIDDPWGDLDAENQARRERSVQEAVKRVGGLAVHVAPAKDAKDR